MRSPGPVGEKEKPNKPTEDKEGKTIDCEVGQIRENIGMNTFIRF
jgi:hypothetical protein